jgi:DNA-binding response OmpR family regulator
MKKILIIEDDYFIQDIYDKAFRKAEYSVEIAKDGQEASAKTADNLYDMILLDIMLPKLNGIEVLKKIRDENAKNFNTPVLLITNLGQSNIIDEAFKLGADGYILKAHTTPQALVEEINKLLTMHAKQETN